MARNIELKAFAELQLQIKELQAKADKIAPAADKQYLALTADEKKTAFTFADRGVVQCTKPSVRKNFGGFYPESFVKAEKIYKALKKVTEDELIEKKQFGHTNSTRAFACKVTAV
jgi:hypothetical protein